MLHRIAFLGIVILFATMNVLLWRSEYAPPETAGSSVSASTVWWKIVTAPDISTLDVSRHGRHLGFLRWLPEVVDAATNALPATDPEVTDMITRPVNYRIMFDGNVLLPGLTNRVRFDGEVILSPRHEWRQFRLGLTLRPRTWEFRSVAAEQTLRVTLAEGTETFSQEFTFAELLHPETLLRAWGGPVVFAGLADAGLAGLPVGSAASLSLGLDWRARESRLRLGHSSLPCYRVETRLLDRYSLVFFVSRAGEILKAELPDDVSIINQQLALP